MLGSALISGKVSTSAVNVSILKAADAALSVKIDKVDQIHRFGGNRVLLKDARVSDVPWRQLFTSKVASETNTLCTAVNISFFVASKAQTDPHVTTMESRALLADAVQCARR